MKELRIDYGMNPEARDMEPTQLNEWLKKRLLDAGFDLDEPINVGHDFLMMEYVYTQNAENSHRR